MIKIEKPIPESNRIDQNIFESKIRNQNHPHVLRGLVNNWPIVESSSDKNTLGNYIKSLYNSAPIRAFVSEETADGHYYYNDTFSGFNFKHIQGNLTSLIDQLCEKNNLKSMYMGSTHTKSILPEFSTRNKLPLLDESIEPRIWIGNKTRISAHYDIPDNIACVAAGKRRFICFPPDQIRNLYIGPLEHTPAGQPLSLVDFNNPDFEKYPKFKEALNHATVAVLEPGDAIYIPVSGGIM